MVHTNNQNEFKTLLDRNGVKIHIGETVLVHDGEIIRGKVVAYSKNYKYVHVIGGPGGTQLYVRHPNNVVIVHNLEKWRHKNHFSY